MSTITIWFTINRFVVLLSYTEIITPKFWNYNKLRTRLEDSSFLVLVPSFDYCLNKNFKTFFVWSQTSAHRLHTPSPFTTGAGCRLWFSGSVGISLPTRLTEITVYVGLSKKIREHNHGTNSAYRGKLHGVWSPGRVRAWIELLQSPVKTLNLGESSPATLT